MILWLKLINVFAEQEGYMMKTSIFSSNKLFKWGTIIGLAILVVVAVMFVLSALGFNRDFKVKETLTVEEAGTIENGALNNGWIAETEEHVLYIDPDAGEMSPGTPKGNLIRRNRDWTGRMELTDNPISYFMVSEDWIYYTDASDKDHLYRMKEDGSENSLVIAETVYACTIAEDTIYYTTLDGLFRSALDGKGQTQLQSKGGTPTVVGDWIYYAEDEMSLSRIKPDGSMDQQLLSDYEDYYLTEDSVYYIMLTETEDESLFALMLYQMGNADTEAAEILVVEDVVTAQLDGGYLYYQLGKGNGRLEKGLYRVNLDGSGTERVNDIMIWQLDYVLGDWMYILQYSGERYRIKLDGSAAVLFQ